VKWFYINRFGNRLLSSSILERISALLGACVITGLLTVYSYAATTIDVAVVWGPGNVNYEGIHDAVVAFEAANPDIKVQLISGYGVDKFQVALASGVAPDVYHGGDTNIKDWIIMGWAEDITEYIERDPTLSPEDYLTPAWIRSVHDGKVWGIPLEAGPAFALFSNVQHFQEVGLSIPRTIEELEEVNQKLVRETTDGGYQRMGIIPWDIIGRLGNGMFAWGWAFGGSLYDEELQRVTPLDDGVVAALEWLAGFNERYPQPTVDSSIPGSAQPRFAQGRVSMMLGITQTVAGLAAQAPDMVYEISEPPSVPGATNPMWIGGHTIFIANGSKQIPEAYRFLKFVGGTPHGSGILSLKGGFLPAYRYSDVLDVYAKDPKMQRLIELSQTSTHVRARIPAVFEYNEALRRAAEAVLAGEKLPRQALGEVQVEIQPKVDALLGR